MAPSSVELERGRAEGRTVLNARGNRIEYLVAIGLSLFSVAALFWYYAHNELLLYGDAVAHINIARRVVDNRSWLSSFFQLGTVWLPLQHLAMLPLIWIDRLWQSGIAGSIPSMLAYVFGGLGIFRLVNSLTPMLFQSRGEDEAPTISLLPAFAATAIYALNPNLLYMQSIVMNEPIFLAFFIWSVVYFGEILRAKAAQPIPSATATCDSRPRAVERCGMCLAGAAWTRYDGWFIAAVIGSLVAIMVLRWLRTVDDRKRRRALARSLIELLLLNALMPVFWLAYNHRVSGRAMDWANGPYSAKAIAERTTQRGAPPYPGKDDVVAAALYFLKAAQLNVGNEAWGKLMLVLAAMGTAIAVWRFRQYGFLLLLWLPLIFYALSIAYGSVPIFVPVWWPFSYYNVRYGLELLPVFAVFPVLLATSAGLAFNLNRQFAAFAILFALVAVSYARVWADAPITLREAQANSRTRIAIEQALTRFLLGLPHNVTILMYQSAHVGALQAAGVPLKNVISEVSHPDWEWALLDPAGKAEYIIAFQGDPVWMSAREHATELRQVIAITVPGQERCTIYVPNALPSPQKPL